MKNAPWRARIMMLLDKEPQNVCVGVAVIYYLCELCVCVWFLVSFSAVLCWWNDHFVALIPSGENNGV